MRKLIIDVMRTSNWS